MIIAQAKKKENIVEYILYMYNVEDLVRSLNLDIAEVEGKLISQYQVTDEVRVQVKAWYVQIIKDMKTFGLMQKGHLPELNELVAELNLLHDSLLHLYQDPRISILIATPRRI